MNAISKVAEDEFKIQVLRHVDSTLWALKESENSDEIIMDFLEPF